MALLSWGYGRLRLHHFSSALPSSSRMPQTSNRIMFFARIGHRQASPRGFDRPGGCESYTDFSIQCRFFQEFTSNLQHMRQRSRKSDKRTPKKKDQSHTSSSICRFTSTIRWFVQTSSGYPGRPACIIMSLASYCRSVKRFREKSRQPVVTLHPFPDTSRFSCCP